MARNKNNFITGQRLLNGKARWLALLFLVFLTACGGGEASENAEKKDAGETMRPGLAEGLKLASEKKYDEAISKVFEMVINNPKDPEALGILSYIYLRSNRLSHAKEAATRSLELDPFQSRPYIVLARVNFQVSKFEKVLDLARTALTINPKSSGAYLIIGEVYLRKGMNDDALVVLQEAEKLDPENSAIVNILASAYIKKKNYDLALSTLIALQEIDPYNPGAHFNLAVVYAKMKKGRKAMRHIATAEDLYARDDKNKYWLGKTRDVRRVIAKDFKLRPEDIN
jgi:tetratricopeptide (TPR) repeat protein